MNRPVGEPRRIVLAEDARRLYRSGLNVEQVAKRLGVGKTTTGKRLVEMGVKIRPSGSRFLHLLSEARLRSLYLAQGYTMKKIATSCGCSVGTVYRVLRMYRIGRD